MTKKSNFPRNFKYFREQARLGQEALAEKIGVNIRTISVYETGKGFPKVDLLMKISEVLNIPVEHFFAEDPEQINTTPAGIPSLDIPSTEKDKLRTKEKIKEYKSSLNAHIQLITNGEGDKDAYNKLTESINALLEDFEAEHSYRKELEVKLVYATDLIRSFAKGTINR